jgi:linoleoyl-CoA desaturase
MRERKPRFSPERSFQDEVRSRVEERLATLDRSRQGGWRIYLKTALLLLWSGASYLALLTWARSGWQVVPLSVSLGLALAAIGFNIAHDGNHGAFSTSRVVNRAMGGLLDLLGASSYVWRWKHNVFHHSYPNVDGLDDDINLGALCRMSRHQPHRPYHRLQHLYMWPLYGFIVPKWQLYDDFAALAGGHIGGNPFPRPRGGELALFLGGKLAFLALAFAIPLLSHPLWQVALVYAGVGLVQGFILSIVFQLAHSNEETRAFSADEPEDIARREWSVHQVETTANFARRSRLLTWYVGGLNHQIEHHLFPRISHVHLPVIAGVVEQVCREHGVRYSAHASLWKAVASHHSWLRSMGRPSPAGISDPDELQRA